MKRIEEIRKWIAVCEAAIPGSIPQELHEMDAYAVLLESEIVHLRAKLSPAQPGTPGENK